MKRKRAKCVLRIVCRCVVFGKFYDGLSAVTSNQKDTEMFCHTWKNLFWGGSGRYANLRGCYIADSIYNY